MEKKALLVVSFGTSQNGAREAAIDKLEQELAAAFPDRKFYQAWTSKIIIRKVRERDGVVQDSVEQALEKMADDGINDLLIQPTNIIKGFEYEDILEATGNAADHFSRIRIGNPLIACRKDYEDVADILKKQADALDADEALVVIGHGTEHYANAVYPELLNVLRQKGCGNIFVGTVEGKPDFDEMQKELSKTDFKKVSMMPFMLVAGLHALEDMAGNDENSWTKRLEKQGYQVHCQIKGLGENAAIRALYLDHARNAYSFPK